MNDIVAAVALIGLSLVSLAAIGWWAIPRAERTSPATVDASHWLDIITTGARVLSTWGPRLDIDFNARQAGTDRPTRRPCTIAN